MSRRHASGRVLRILTASAVLFLALIDGAHCTDSAPRSGSVKTSISSKLTKLAGGGKRSAPSPAIADASSPDVAAAIAKARGRVVLPPAAPARPAVRAADAPSSASPPPAHDPDAASTVAQTPSPAEQIAIEEAAAAAQNEAEQDAHAAEENAGVTEVQAVRGGMEDAAEPSPDAAEIAHPDAEADVEHAGKPAVASAVSLPAHKSSAATPVSTTARVSEKHPRAHVPPAAKPAHSVSSKHDDAASSHAAQREPLTASISHSSSHRGLDASHAVGDVDVLHSALAEQRAEAGEAPVQRSASFWAPANGALILLLLVAAVITRQVVLYCRRSNVSSVASAAASESSIIMRILSLFSPTLTQAEKKSALGMGMDSPPGAELKRELASLSIIDKKTRMRREAKARADTHGDEDEHAAELLRHSSPDIESRMSASLLSVPAPKLLYLHTAKEIDATPNVAESPVPASGILTPELVEKLLPYLPPTAQLQDLACVYKLSVCGASLKDLYRRCEDTSDSLLVIQDSAGYTFGCYVSTAWTEHERYYGTGTCFVFTLQPEFRVYSIPPPSAASSVSNSFFQLATRSALALGGGDHFALWVDDALRRGTSQHCNTFNSPCLAKQEQFTVHELECWAFVDSRW